MNGTTALSARMILRLLAGDTARSRAQGGFIMTPLMLGLIGVVVSSLGVVAAANWSSFSSVSSGQGSDAQHVAEAGADQVIATFNQPENRQLLVAGTTPPNTWSTTNENLRSPCISTSNTRPGTTNGYPSATAVGLADGQFRNLDNLSQAGAGTRRFSLKSIRYSVGGTGASNRRGIYRTYTLPSGSVSSEAVQNLPQGGKFSDLVNLDDPDGGDPTPAGSNTGYIAITVEGRTYRPDGTFSTATITKEYEVLPKCCGGSFGGNGTGGLQSDGTPSDPKNRLGADSRFCGVDWGMIVGLNGGRVFSQAANDRYTRRNNSNKVVDISSFLAILANKRDTWSRAAVGYGTVGGYSMQLGCRTVPSPCNINNDAEDKIPGDSFTIGQYLDSRLGKGAATGVCPEDQNNNGNRPIMGNRASIEGRAASCIPFVPVFLPSGLPSIAANYSYTWTPGGNPAAVAGTRVDNSNVPTSYGGYPSFILTRPEDSDVRIWLRANSASAQNTATGASTPYLEYCNTKYVGQCASVYQPGGSTIHTWAIVSQGGNVPTKNGSGIAIGDDFASNTYTSYATGSTPRWPSVWQEREAGGITATPTTGDVYLSGGEAIFTDVSTDYGTNYAQAPAIARAVNLYMIDRPVIEVTFATENAASTDDSLILDYSFDTTQKLTTDSALTTDTGWARLASLRGNNTLVAGNNGETLRGCSYANYSKIRWGGLLGLTPYTRFYYKCQIQLPDAATAAANPFSHWVKFRLRSGSNLSDSSFKRVYLDAVEVKSWNGSSVATPRYKNWCEYSASIPATTNFTGGFHCLGPSVNLQAAPSQNGASGNRFWVDTTDASISFYYNSSNDFRGTSVATPLIYLYNGATIANVYCPRGTPTTTSPTENCTSLWPETIYNAVAEYERFNIFGRDSAPGATCEEFNVPNSPCMQIVALAADSGPNSPSRARLAGTWIYMPWGLVSFAVNGCGNITAMSFAEFKTDDSWNYGGRLWARSIYSCGQNHFRVPPSSSNNLNALLSIDDSEDLKFVSWSGQDWMARAASSARKGVSLK